MILVAFETATPCGGFAIIQDGEVLAERVIRGSQRHSAECLTMLGECLSEAGLAITDIDYFGASHGPGAFTGIRVGLSLIKGLAFVTGRRCVTVSTLEVMAHSAAQIAEGSATLVPVLDARMGEVYAAQYRNLGALVEELSEARCLTPKALRALLPGDALVFGPAVLAYPELINAGRGKIDQLVQELRPSMTAALCWQYALRGHTVSPQQCEAIYLRHPVKEKH